MAKLQLTSRRCYQDEADKNNDYFKEMLCDMILK
uniref:Transposase n=1 Tax=Heterorhabditis bacteriophora TaxID=37862 RepID=A0A1I7WLD0_HETBA